MKDTVAPKAKTDPSRKQLESLLRPAFSQHGIDRVVAERDEFLTNLIDEANRVAKRKQADTCGPEHVQIARANLISSEFNRRSSVQIALGGVATGGALSGWLGMVATTSYPVVAVIPCVILSIGGLTSFTWGLARSLR